MATCNAIGGRAIEDHWTNSARLKPQVEVWLAVPVRDVSTASFLTGIPLRAFHSQATDEDVDNGSVIQLLLQTERSQTAVAAESVLRGVVPTVCSVLWD